MDGKTPNNLLKEIAKTKNEHLNAIGKTSRRPLATPATRTPPTFIHDNLAPAIAISGENFVERQESAGCGRHALNNLLGGVNFINEYRPKPRDISNISQLPPGPVALQTICRYFHRKTIGKVSADDCPDNEFYDISVLEVGMCLFGYTSRNLAVHLLNPVFPGVPISRRNKVEIMNEIRDLDQHYIGFIVHFRAHWTAIKKLSDVRFRYIDSLYPNTVLTDTLENIIIHRNLKNADYIIPYYGPGLTTDYTITHTKQTLQPGRILSLTREQAVPEYIKKMYTLPEDHILVQITGTENNQGTAVHMVVPKNSVPAAASAAAPAPAPAPAPATAPASAAAPALPPPPAPAPAVAPVAPVATPQKKRVNILRILDNISRREGIERFKNTVNASGTLHTSTRQHPPVRESTPVTPYRPVLDEILENNNNNNNNNSLPTTPFFSYNGQIIKVLSRLDDGRIRYVELIEENGVNIWGEEKTRNIPDTELIPIICPPTKQEGGRRKTMRTKAKGRGNGRANVRPTRRHRKRA